MAEPPSSPVSAARADARQRRRRRSRLGGTFQSLSVQQYRRYMVSFVGSGIGFQSMLVATSWLTWRLTESEFMLTAVLLMSGVAQVFMAPVGGVVADRFAHKPIMVWMQVVIMANGAVLGVLVMADLVEVWHLFVSAGMFGAANSFHMPSRQSFVFNLVGKQHLQNALALNAGAMSSMRLIGPAVGGVLIAWLGEQAVYFIVAGGYAVSIMILTFFIRPDGAPGRVSEESPIAAFKGGVGYLLGHPVLKWLIVGLMGATLIGLPFRDVLPAVADVLGQGAEGFGLLLSMSGLGALVGSLVIASWPNMRAKGKIYIVTGVAWGAAVVLLAVSPNLASAIVMMIVLGAISTNYNTINNILVQTHVDDAYRGRVLSFLMIMFGLHLVGAVIIGSIAEFTGIRWALAGSGAAMVLFALYLGIVRSEIRRLD